MRKFGGGSKAQFKCSSHNASKPGKARSKADSLRFLVLAGLSSRQRGRDVLKCHFRLRQ
jgi:hypothetical protein